MHANPALHSSVCVHAFPCNAGNLVGNWYFHLHFIGPQIWKPKGTIKIKSDSHHYMSHNFTQYGSTFYSFSASSIYTFFNGQMTTDWSYYFLGLLWLLVNPPREKKTIKTKFARPFVFWFFPFIMQEMLLDLGSWSLDSLFIRILWRWTMTGKGNKLNTAYALHLWRVSILELTWCIKMLTLLQCNRLWKTLLINPSNSLLYFTCCFPWMIDCCIRSLKKFLKRVTEHTQKLDTGLSRKLF